MFQNLTITQHQDLFIEQSKKLMHYMRYGSQLEYETLRNHVDDIFMALEKRKKITPRDFSGLA